jgi:hypothetical protein
MVVAIHGYNAGSYFAANEVDTPYTLYGAVPYYEGQPWYYWGPSVSLGFFFGSGGWWRGGYHGGGYYAHPYGGAYGYRGGYGPRGAYYSHPTSTYRAGGGAYRYPSGAGRSYAPAARGGSYRAGGTRGATAHASASHGGGHH